MALITPDNFTGIIPYDEVYGGSYVSAADAFYCVDREGSTTRKPIWRDAIYWSMIATASHSHVGATALTDSGKPFARQLLSFTAYSSQAIQGFPVELDAMPRAIGRLSISVHQDHRLCQVPI